MSTLITQAFVDQFKANILLQAQQMNSKLASTVRNEPFTNGESAYFERLAPTDGYDAATRHEDTRYVNAVHSRRKVFHTTKRWADLIDNPDKVKTLIQPSNDYVSTARAFLNRQKDIVIIKAASGNAYSGRNGETAVALPAGQKVAAGAANLTMAKLASALEILNSADIDENEPKFIVYSPKMLTAMLTGADKAQFTSSDYNTLRALQAGKFDGEFMGFQWIMSNRLEANATADGKLAVAYAKNGLGLIVPEDITVKVDELPTKNYSTQVFVEAIFGATRIEDEKVVQIDCVGG